MALPTDSRRDHLKRRWLQQAEAAFELMFDADLQDRLVTFDQREARACSLTRELAAWLLESHIAEDPAVRPADIEPPACPRCSRPARREAPPEDLLPARSLTSAAGEVTLRRQRWYCPTCRAAFFPSGPQARPGDRGL
jgi:hypothetical protein